MIRAVDISEGYEYEITAGLFASNGVEVSREERRKWVLG